MVELTPGSQVFIYQNLVQQAIAKSSYKAAASFLLNCFYTNDGLLGMNLAGANGKPYPDKHILGAIIGTNLHSLRSNNMDVLIPSKFTI